MCILIIFSLQDIMHYFFNYFSYLFTVYRRKITIGFFMLYYIIKNKPTYILSIFIYSFQFYIIPILFFFFPKVCLITRKKVMTFLSLFYEKERKKNNDTKYFFFTFSFTSNLKFQFFFPSLPFPPRFKHKY